MNNKQKYDQVFMESFSIDESVLGDNLEYNSIPEWDSVGHMSLIAELEEVFDIMMEMDLLMKQIRLNMVIIDRLNFINQIKIPVLQFKNKIVYLIQFN